uniref:Uncharacterized protein n=1 Tax=Lepeophtheirus salmonis TaxID=72036 RepID=A0A0K2VLM1_LEPSM
MTASHLSSIISFISCFLKEMSFQYLISRSISELFLSPW